MGRIRDELYGSMWDSVTCVKHNITRSDSRFPCPECQREQQISFEIELERAKELLKPHNLTHLLRTY